jgi:hypothetical protein
MSDALAMAANIGPSAGWVKRALVLVTLGHGSSSRW